MQPFKAIKSIVKTTGSILGGFANLMTNSPTDYSSKKEKTSKKNKSEIEKENVFLLDTLFKVMRNRDTMRMLEEQEKLIDRKKSESLLNDRNDEIIKALSNKKTSFDNLPSLKKEETLKDESGNVVGKASIKKRKPTDKKINVTTKKGKAKPEAKPEEKPKATPEKKAKEKTKTASEKKAAEKQKVPEKVETPKKTEVQKTPTKTTPKTATPVPKITPAKTVAGVALSAAAATSIAGETGATSEKSILEKNSQVVKNDPKPGVYSFGVFGINSGKDTPGKVQKGSSLYAFINDNPHLGLNTNMTLPELESAWKQLSQSKPTELLQAQNSWYEKYVMNPVLGDLMNFDIAEKIKTDAAAISFMADRRNQQGTVGLNGAMKSAKGSNSTEEFISKVAQFDIDNLDNAFPTAISTAKNKENFKLGLARRSKLRAERALGKSIDLRYPGLNQNVTPQGSVKPTSSKVGVMSTENKDVKRELSETNNTTSIINNISNTQSTSGGVSRPSVDDRPVYQIKKDN